MYYQIKRNSTVIANVVAEGYLRSKIMGEEVVEMTFTSASPINFQIGDHVVVYGQTFVLNVAPMEEKVSSLQYNYTLNFESIKYELGKIQLLFPDSSNVLAISDFSVMGDARRVLELIIENANRVQAGWKLGVIDASETKNFSFSAHNLLTALTMLADEFKNEFWIDQDKTINFTKREAFSGLSLQYGISKGIRSLTRSVVDSSNIVTRLYAYGSEKNISNSYRNHSNRLRMDVAFLENNKELFGIIEHTEIFEDIYPKRIGKVTAITQDNFLQFTDSELNFDLNSNEILINKVAVKVTFNTGQLAGYTFEVKEHGFNFRTKTFELKINENEKAIQVPSELMRPSVGDEYVLTDIIMPKEYLDLAEAELKVKANDYLLANSFPRLQYSVVADPFYFEDQNISIDLGSKVKLLEPDFNLEAEIRVISLSKNLQNQYEVDFELADEVNFSNIVREYLDDQNWNNQVIQHQQNIDRNIRRNYQFSQEIQENIFDGEGYFDVEKIKPLSIQTKMLSVGARSQQFSIKNAKVTIVNNTTVKNAAGQLVHFTIADTEKVWNILSATINNITAVFQYIYLKCQKNGSNASFLITSAQIKVDEDPNFYHFEYGFLSAITDGYRRIRTSFGFTDINGGELTTGRILGQNGQLFIDIDNREIVGKVTLTSDSPAIGQIMDGIKIGGVNLFEKSTFKALPSIGEKTHMPILVDKTPDGIDLQKNTKGLQLVTSGAANKDVYFLLDQNINIAPGEYYTLSFDLANAIGSGSMRSNCFIYFDNGVKLPLYDADFNGFHIPTTRSIAFKTAVGSKSLKIRLGFSSTSTATAWVIFSKIMLEKGNKPTAWQPSPNDSIEEIDSFSSEMKKVAEVTSFLNTTIDGNVVATGLLMVGSGNQSNAGISGLNEAGPNSVRLWAGGTSQNRSKAKWMICDNGVERTYHPNGNLATVKGIIDGVFVYDFYHENGAKLFELSPNRGLVNVAYIPESYISKKFFDVNQSGANLNQGSATAAIKANLSFRYYEEQNSSGQIEVIKVTSLQENFYCLQYDCGTKPDNLQFEKNNGYKASQSRYDNVKDGWFGFAVGEIDYQSPSNNPNFSFDYILYFIQGGKVMKNQKIIIPN